MMLPPFTRARCCGVCGDNLCQCVALRFPVAAIKILLGSDLRGDNNAYFYGVWCQRSRNIWTEL